MKEKNSMRSKIYWYIDKKKKVTAWKISIDKVYSQSERRLVKHVKSDKFLACLQVKNWDFKQSKRKKVFFF